MSDGLPQDYKIGFGSFVDKELFPYISLISEENCQQATKNCPPPYRSVAGRQPRANYVGLINQIPIFLSRLILLIVAWF